MPAYDEINRNELVLQAKTEINAQYLVIEQIRRQTIMQTLSADDPESLAIMKANIREMNARLIINLLKKNFSVKDIADLNEASLEEIQEVSRLYEAALVKVAKSLREHS